MNTLHGSTGVRVVGQPGVAESDVDAAAEPPNDQCRPRLVAMKPPSSRLPRPTLSGASSSRSKRSVLSSSILAPKLIFHASVTRSADGPRHSVWRVGSCASNDPPPLRRKNWRFTTACGGSPSPAGRCPSRTQVIAERTVMTMSTRFISGVPVAEVRLVAKQVDLARGTLLPLPNRRRHGCSAARRPMR